MSFKREVTRVEETNGRTGNVAFECLGTLRQEEGIVLPPYCQEAWLVRPEVILESRIERDVTLVVAEQVQLNLVGAEAGQIEVVERIAVRRNRGYVEHTMRVLPARRVGREEGAERGSVGLRRLLPISANGIPAIAEPFLVGVAVLGDDCSDTVRVPNGEAEAHRRAIV